VYQRPHQANHRNLYWNPSNSIRLFTPHQQTRPKGSKGPPGPKGPPGGPPRSADCPHPGDYPSRTADSRCRGRYWPVPDEVFVMTDRRCEALTRKGGRCKSKAVVYHRHTDGCEYLACNFHHSEDFRPATAVAAKPPDNLACA